MNRLDHKIPPPVIAILSLLLAWILARSAPGFECLFAARLPIAVVFVIAGLVLDVSALVVFRRANTTPNPLSPERSTSIVLGGPFRFTRNPMYLGLALMLIGFCVYLGNPMSLIALVVFVAYITRFQIMPEEHALLAKFAEPYAHYMRSVRRWL